MKSKLDDFLTTVRKYADSDCTNVTYAMEVTGVYSDNIFEFIHSSLNDNENVYFLNTQYVNKWRESHDIAIKASKNRTKSDKIDELFDLCNDSLAPTEVSDSIRSIIRAQVAFIIEIKSQINTLEKMIKELGANHQMFEKLKTLTGCGDVTAATVIAETYDIKLFKSADKYVSYMGLAPRNKRSGSSVEIMSKISKKGSRFLRHTIYMISEFARRQIYRYSDENGEVHKFIYTTK